MRAPDIELPLDSFRVGVLRRVEATVGVVEVAEDVADGLLEDLAVARLLGDLPGVQINAAEHRLVVEHLLEVGDQPEGVNRVPGEAAAEVVVDAARGHGVDGGGDHLEDFRSTAQGGGAQQKLEARFLRKLGRLPEAAPLTVELTAQ